MKAVMIGLTGRVYRFSMGKTESRNIKQAVKKTDTIITKGTLGGKFNDFSSTCSNPIHQTRIIFHTPSKVQYSTQVRVSFRTENKLGRKDLAHSLDPLIPVF